MSEKQKSFVLDEVVSIEKFGISQTYDFTIPETHCFFANDVLVHNSGVLEEHPDVVFLLHSVPDEKGDLKKYYFFVAKNRNGRIGKINMAYEGKHYKFADEHIDPPAQQSFERKDWEE